MHSSAALLALPQVHSDVAPPTFLPTGTAEAGRPVVCVHARAHSCAWGTSSSCRGVVRAPRSNSCPHLSAEEGVALPSW